MSSNLVPLVPVENSAKTRLASLHEKIQELFASLYGEVSTEQGVYNQIVKAHLITQLLLVEFQMAADPDILFGILGHMRREVEDRRLQRFSEWADDTMLSWAIAEDDEDEDDGGEEGGDEGDDDGAVDSIIK